MGENTHVYKSCWSITSWPSGLNCSRRGGALTTAVTGAVPVGSSPSCGAGPTEPDRGKARDACAFRASCTDLSASAVEAGDRGRTPVAAAVVAGAVGRNTSPLGSDPGPRSSADSDALNMNGEPPPSPSSIVAADARRTTLALAGTLRAGARAAPDPAADPPAPPAAEEDDDDDEPADPPGPPAVMPAAPVPSLALHARDELPR
jgi:hypothetical protein